MNYYPLKNLIDLLTGGKRNKNEITKKNWRNNYKEKRSK